jgi:uncharacterized membrane protein YfcA
MEIFQMLTIYAAIMFGAICKGAIGMGFALIAAPIVLILNPAFVPVPMILSSFLLSLLVISRDRVSIDVSGLRIAILGRVVGAMIAALIISMVSTNLFDIIFGGIILIAVLSSLLDVSWKLSPAKLFGAGLASGIMATFSSVGGPPMALLYQHQKGAVIRGTLSGFSLIGQIISLLALSLAGKFTVHEFSLFTRMIPAVLVGFFLSRYLVRGLDKGYTRGVILTVSALSALTAIIKAVKTFF